MEQRQLSRDEQRERIRQKIQTNTEERQLIVIPADPVKALTDASVEKRVCAYCRVSTDDPAQTTSYELQKKHYEQQINDTPGWTFAGIYADEGISATSLKNRDEFNRMIEDCYAGKIDVIITKNVSRFARNVVDCLSVVRKLAQLNPPVGVKFETEGFMSLDNTSEMILTVLAAAAQEESKTKSNSMNWSLEHRFDNGNFLTPVLLGFDHDKDGNLVVNPDEAFTVRMIFYLYLYGFPLSEIAELLTDLKRLTKKGNTRWSAASVRSILTNERHCGNVLSWKTYTYDFWEHKKRKNNKDRRQVLEINHHEAIVSHEIFDAAQAKLQSERYMRKRHPLPTLDVVDDGALKGFVSVSRLWYGFSDNDYQAASESVYTDASASDHDSGGVCDSIPEKDETENNQEGAFGLDQFEIVRSQFFSMAEKPLMTIGNKRVSFNTMCMKKFQDVEYVELLVNTVEKCVAIRPCDEESPNAIHWGRKKGNRWFPSPKSISGFAGALLSITGWNPENRYRLCGQYLTDGEAQMLVFDLEEPEIIRLVAIGEVSADSLMDLSADEASKSKADNRNPDPVSVSETNVSYSMPEAINDAGGTVHGAEGHALNTFGTNTGTAVNRADDSTDTEENESVTVYTVERAFPAKWDNHFGPRVSEQRSMFIERIRYQGNWEILRPSVLYATVGDIGQEILREIQTEARKMLEEMGCAV